MSGAVPHPGFQESTDQSAEWISASIEGGSGGSDPSAQVRRILPLACRRTEGRGRTLKPRWPRWTHRFLATFLGHSKNSTNQFQVSACPRLMSRAMPGMPGRVGWERNGKRQRARCPLTRPEPGSDLRAQRVFPGPPVEAMSSCVFPCSRTSGRNHALSRWG